MRFVRDDGGRGTAGFQGRAGDCVVRALAIAMQRPYADVYRELAEGNASERQTKHSGRASGRRTARDGINVRRQWFKEYMGRHGWRWTPTMHIGSGCVVHLADGELPMGRLIVSVSRHYTAVVDGVIRDTHDPSERGVTIYSPGSRDVPKGARWLENGNGWAYEPKRCVYGYWSKAEPMIGQERPS